MIEPELTTKSTRKSADRSKAVIIFEGHTLTLQARMVPSNIAAEFMKRNKKNRPIPAHNVRRYSATMSAKKWFFNGEPIIFSDTGDLLDGQTRLTACIDSGVPFPALIIWGVPAKAFVTLGRGKTRSSADNVALEGYRNYVQLSGAASHLFHYLNGEVDKIGTSTNRPEPTDILAILKANKSLEDHVSETTHLRNIMAISVAGFCRLLFWKQNEKKAEQFFDQLATGENLTAGSPVLQLRNRLFEKKHGHARRSSYTIALTFKAWNLFKNGETIVNLRYAKTEDFPTIE